MKASSPTYADRLRGLLHERTKRAAERALADGAHVPDVDELERLERLANLADAAQPKQRKRWPIAVALGATLVAVSLLLFARVPSTQVELDVIASETEFTVPSRVVITENMNVAALGVAGLANFALPGFAASPAAAQSDAGQAVRIASIGAAQNSGTVSLSELTVPAGTRVSIRVDGERRYRIGLSKAEQVMRVGVLGPTEIGVAGAPLAKMDFAAPRSLELRSAGNDVDMDVTLAGESFTFSPLLPVSQLALFRVDDYADRNQSVVRRISAIQSGTLIFESLNGQEKRLRAGQALSFSALDGEIRSLQLGAGKIALQLHGRVRGMKTGSAANVRSLMPTWLEWLYARHGLTLLWGTTLYVFGLGATVLRWWRRSSLL